MTSFWIKLCTFFFLKFGVVLGDWKPSAVRTRHNLLGSETAFRRDHLVFRACHPSDVVG